VSPRAKWAVVWTGWALYFTAAERIALRGGHPDAPLSAHLRFVLGARKRSLHTRAGQVCAVAGVVWLADHLYSDR
jgi:hypothetical protein